MDITKVRKGCFILGVALALTSFGAIEKIPLKEGWKFIKKDDPAIGTNYSMQAMSDVLDRADKGDLSGAPKTTWSSVAFDDSAWKDVRVPHDWGVEKSYNPALAYGDAFLPVTGIGWYRKVFRVNQAAKGTVFFECDGAMSYAHVWVNGHFVGGWPYGYTRFRLDVTKYLKEGAENTLAIRCHNVEESSRWYTGGGLYRNCRILVCPEDYVVPGSIRITTPEVTPKRAKVCVRYVMAKSGAQERTFTIENPHLWDIEDPYLYTVDIEGNAYRYGIRTIAFHADERRFQLNGRTIPLNGVSMHHDFGVLGAAWNRAAQKRRLLLFKEAGVNAIRSSHNPPEEELLELCDELGILVKDECFDEWRIRGDAGKRKNGYTNLFDVWHARDIRRWVQTDRNHPCVILYSIGNEICDLKPWTKNLAGGIQTARELARLVALEDPTRPTTNANNEPINYTNCYPQVLAVMGCNYFPWQYPRLKAAYPDVPFFGTETICMGTTRGYYDFPILKRGPRDKEVKDFAISSYCWSGANWDGNINHGWAVPPDVQWYWMDQVGTCMGEFVWTGIDYLGGPYWCDSLRKIPKFSDAKRQARALQDVKELGLTREAIHSCDSGFLDQAGFKKDAFYLFQSRWRPDYPMAHILPHWTWPERVGKVTPVYVFTSGDEAELFLNGRSLGRQKKQPGVWDRAYRLRWDDVVYEPGRLEVVAYRAGKEWARDCVCTAGKAARLTLTPEGPSVLANGEDVQYVTIALQDLAGTLVPRDARRVAVTLKGPGEIVAVDNGDEANMDDFKAAHVRIFHGLAQVIVRPHKGARGTLSLTAQAEGLPPASATIQISD